MSIKAYGIDDAKWFPLLTAGDRCTGGVADPTYDDGIDIPCVSDFTWSPERSEGELNGDDTTCAEVSRIKKITLTITHGGLSPELLDEFFGNTRSTFSLVGPPAVEGAETIVRSGDAYNRGGLIVRSIGADDASDVHVIFPNVRMKTGPDGNFAFESFYESTFEGTAEKSLYDPCDMFYRIIEHTNGAFAIPTAWPDEAQY